MNNKAEFIIYAIFSDNSIHYITNTSPILWGAFENAKIYCSNQSAVDDLNAEFEIILNYMKNDNIKSIWIGQFIDGVKIGGERFL